MSPQYCLFLLSDQIFSSIDTILRSPQFGWHALRSLLKIRGDFLVFSALVQWYSRLKVRNLHKISSEIKFKRISFSSEFFINLLQMRIFQPLGRLTYCIYLCHFDMMRILVTEARENMFGSQFAVVSTTKKEFQSVS